MMIQVAHYAGWLAGHNGQCLALEQYQQAATAKQLETLEKAGRDHPEKLTRGEAADLIAELRAG
ncbi:MAG: hypothetical protein VYC91_03180 [Acidobacteriota bacterium]|nr:hypothetical protein [Acidobacteriota bacterium]